MKAADGTHGGRIPVGVAENCDDLLRRLGVNHPTAIPQLVKGGWANLSVGTTVTPGNPLFPRIGDNRFETLKKEDSPKIQTRSSATPPPATSSSSSSSSSSDASVKGKGVSPKSTAVTSAVVDVSRLDLRVGKIVKVDRHPDADHLYIEEIDVGDGKPRQVCSGLAKFIPIEAMRDRLVVVVCNMKATNFRGVKSEAMVLAANSEDKTKVELVDPPATCAPGTRIKVDGYDGAPDDELNPKQKVFDTLKPDLRSNGARVACYKGSALKTPQGDCTVPTLPNSQLG